MRHMESLKGHTCSFYMFSFSHFTMFRYILGGCTSGDTSCYVLRCKCYYFMKFGMLKTHICLYFLGFVLLEMVCLLLWGLNTSFILELSIYMVLCTCIHGVGCLGIHTCGLVTHILWTTCLFLRLVINHSLRNILLFDLPCTLCYILVGTLGISS